MNSSRIVISNTLAQYLGRLGTILLSLVTTGLLTRNLGKVGYGQFSLITTTAIFFTALADWGINVIAVREASSGNRDEQMVFRSSTAVKLLLSLVSTTLFMLFVFLYPPFQSFRNVSLLASPLIFTLSLRTSALIVYHARLKLYFPAFTEFLGSLSAFFLLFLFLAINSGITLANAILVILASTLLNTLLTAYPVIRSIFPRRINPSFAKTLFRNALPMGAFLLVFSIYNRIDSYILQYFHGDAQTGIYALSYKIHENLVLGAAYLMNSVFPFLSQDKANIKEIFSKVLNLLVVASFFVLVLGLLFSSQVISVLGGDQFLASSPVFRILVFATAISYLNHLTGYTLISLGEQSSAFKFSLIALVLNLVLNLLFIPRFSIMAAAINTILTELIMLLLTSRLLIKKYHFSLYPRNIIGTLTALLTLKPKSII